MFRCSKPEIVVSYMFYLLVSYFGNIRMHNKYRETYMADVLFIIVLRQFWSRRLFFGKQALPKKIGGAYVDKQNWHNCADRSDQYA